MAPVYSRRCWAPRSVSSMTQQSTLQPSDQRLETGEDIVLLSSNVCFFLPHPFIHYSLNKVESEFLMNPAMCWKLESNDLKKRKRKRKAWFQPWWSLKSKREDSLKSCKWADPQVYTCYVEREVMGHGGASVAHRWFWHWGALKGLLFGWIVELSGRQKGRAGGGMSRHRGQGPGHDAPGTQETGAKSSFFPSYFPPPSLFLWMVILEFYVPS